MKRQDAVFFGLLAAGIAGFALYARAPAASAEAAFSGEPELIAATFNSQWCSACKIVKPRLRKVIPDFAGAPVKFVEYDLTFGNGGAPREKAEADGISSVYERFSTATGYTLLVDAETGDILDMLTVEHTASAMRAAISAALARAEAPPPA
jgi:hypothetical protein